MSEKRSYQPNLVFGVLLIALGLLFLAGQFFRVNFWEISWPFFILAPGLIFLTLAISGGPKSSGFAVPGSVLSVLGLIFVFQTLTDHFASWAYVWALIFPTAIGLGMFIMGVRTENDELRAQGRGLLRAGVVLFVALGVFFETIFRLGDNLLSRLFWPVAIIALGLYLILRQTGLLRPSRTQEFHGDNGMEIEEVPSVHGADDTESE